MGPSAAWHKAQPGAKLIFPPGPCIFPAAGAVEGVTAAIEEAREE
jgi:hypothetical protein